MVTIHARGAGSNGGLPSLFRARNDAADVYGWSKESSRDSLRALISFGCALGVFKLLRSTKKAGKLMAFMEASGLGTTVYQLLGLLRKFTLNPLARLLPWVARKRKIKLGHTQALFNFLKARDIKTDDQLPSDEHVRTKTDKKMMEQLRTRIGHGGLDADTNWVENLMIKEEPDYAGGVPPEIMRCIAQINNPQPYSRHSATLRKGLPILGAPGGGKTTLARLMAYETKCPFIEASPAALMNTFVGTGPNALKGFFDNAENAALAAHRKRLEKHELKLRHIHGFFGYNWLRIKRLFGTSEPEKHIKPTILCWNEIDAIGNKRDAKANDHQERINTLLQLLNSIDEHSHVFVVGTSNKDQDYFDEALIRPGRMGTPVRLPLPNASDRFEIIKHYLKKIKTLSSFIQIPDVDYTKITTFERLWNRMCHRRRLFNPYEFWNSIVNHTETFSGDEIRQLFNDAAMIAGDENSSYLGKAHIQGALESMLAEMPEARRERCSATRPQVDAAKGPAVSGSPVLGIQVDVATKTYRELEPDVATMDGETISDI